MSSEHTQNGFLLIFSEHGRSVAVYIVYDLEIVIERLKSVWGDVSRPFVDTILIGYLAET